MREPNLRLTYATSRCFGTPLFLASRTHASSHLRSAQHLCVLVVICMLSQAPLKALLPLRGLQGAALEGIDGLRAGHTVDGELRLRGLHRVFNE